MVDDSDPSRRRNVRILPVSTAFNIGTFTRLPEPDVVLVSSDDTLFYFHETMLFGTIIHVALADLRSGSSNPMTISLYSLRVYAHSACHKTYSLVIRASSYLLSYPIPIALIPDKKCKRMGVIYLRKLFLLQMERKERLIGPLFSPSYSHRSVTGCRTQEQKVLKSLWAGALVNLTCDLRAGEFISSSHRLTQIWAETCQVFLIYHSFSLDVSSAILQRTFESLKAQPSCSQCLHTLQNKINEVIRTRVSIKVCPSPSKASRSKFLPKFSILLDEAALLPA